MKKIINLLIITGIMIVITSCSAIIRYTTYCPYKEEDGWDNRRVGYFIGGYMHTAIIEQNINYVVTEGDTLFLQIIPGKDAIFIGPVLIPVFNEYLFPWALAYQSRLEIKLSSQAMEGYEIDSSNVHFIINNKEEIYPVKILQEHERYVFYFDVKLKKIKQLAIHINNAETNNVNQSIPALFLKRKYKLDYRPFLWH